MFKVNSKDTRATLVLMFLLLTLSRQMPAGLPIYVAVQNVFHINTLFCMFPNFIFGLKIIKGTSTIRFRQA